MDNHRVCWRKLVSSSWSKATKVVSLTQPRPVPTSILVQVVMCTSSTFCTTGWLSIWGDKTSAGKLKTSLGLPFSRCKPESTLPSRLISAACTTSGLAMVCSMRDSIAA